MKFTSNGLFLVILDSLQAHWFSWWPCYGGSVLLMRLCCQWSPRGLQVLPWFAQTSLPLMVDMARVRIALGSHEDGSWFYLHLFCLTVFILGRILWLSPLEILLLRRDMGRKHGRMHRDATDEAFPLLGALISCSGWGPSDVISLLSCTLWRSSSSCLRGVLCSGRKRWFLV